MKTPSEMSGLELREAVAIEVMGWRLARLIPGGLWWFDGKRPVASVDDPEHDGPPAYESSIEAAFAVVEKLEAAPEKWLSRMVRQCGVLTRKVDTIAWMCEFRACIGPAGHCFYAIGADEHSLPLAICRASLQAVRAAK